MAIKDWERYKNEKTDVRYTNDAGKLWLYIDGFKSEKYGWSVKVRTSDSYPIENKEFSTRALALNFAKSYMKNN